MKIKELIAKLVEKDQNEKVSCRIMFDYRYENGVKFYINDVLCVNETTTRFNLEAQND